MKKKIIKIKDVNETYLCLQTHDFLLLSSTFCRRACVKNFFFYDSLNRPIYIFVFLTPSYTTTVHSEGIINFNIIPFRPSTSPTR